MDKYRYAVVGNFTARVRNDSGVGSHRVRKKAHMIGENGRSVCNAENAFKNPPPLHFVQDDDIGVCYICQKIVEDRTAEIVITTPFPFIPGH